MTTSTNGSQRLLQIAVTHRPELLTAALRRSGAVGRREAVRWVSPLPEEQFAEYRDQAALERLELTARIRTPLTAFWPARGAVWDALGIAGSDRPLLLEAKAHIAEAASPGSKASPASLVRIEKALAAARRHYAPRSKAPWSSTFYQYANRLAHQFYFRELNGIESSLVFLYFTNAVDVDGPTSEDEWRGALRLIHTLLGLPADLSGFGVHEAFLDARLLSDAV